MAAGHGKGGGVWVIWSSCIQVGGRELAGARIIAIQGQCEHQGYYGRVGNGVIGKHGLNRYMYSL